MVVRNEEWKVIEGYEDYSVSNLGRVKKEDIKKLTVNDNGYSVTSLSNESGKKVFGVHRLVYEAFGEKLRRNQYIGHVDKNKGNNSFENLVITTRLGAIPLDPNSIKTRSKEFGGEFTMKELADEYSVNVKLIFKILYGEKVKE